MFEIICAFEEKSGADARDPLGDLKFTDGQSSIAVPATYLDSWIDALIKSLVKIRQGKGTQVSIPEEPASLRVDVEVDGKIRLTREDAVVTAEDGRAFEDALVEASRFFLSWITGQGEAAHNPAIQNIRVFCEVSGGSPTGRDNQRS